MSRKASARRVARAMAIDELSCCLFIRHAQGRSTGILIYRVCLAYAISLSKRQGYKNRDET